MLLCIWCDFPNDPYQVSSEHDIQTLGFLFGLQDI